MTSTVAERETSRRLSPSRRRVVRNVTLALATTAATLGLVAVLPVQNAVPRWSMATAYVALALLVACLAVGPLNVLRGRPNPVSTHLRRDLGIWGGSYGLLHLVIGLNVHMGHPWFYFIYKPEEGEHRIPLRHDLFGFANYTGLASGIILAVLLAISNDAALRRLGSGRWKSWQRWNYVATALFVLHGIVFQVVERRALPIVLLCAAALAFAIVVQLAAIAERRRAAR